MILNMERFVEGIINFSKKKKYMLKKKKKEQIQREVNTLVYSHWLPSFRSASDEIFQAVLLPLDLRKIVESFLFNVKIQIYPFPLYPRSMIKARIQVSADIHLDLGKALNFSRRFYGDTSAYPVLNRACYKSAKLLYWDY